MNDDPKFRRRFLSPLFSLLAPSLLALTCGSVAAGEAVRREAGDAAVVKQIFSPAENIDRRGLIEKLADDDLRRQLTRSLKAIERAAISCRRVRQLTADVKAVGGKIELGSAGPDDLRQMVGDEAMKLFDLPVVINLYNGNNPLKGKGGLNTRVNDAWLERLAGLTSVKRLDLANCDVHGAGMRHVATLTGLENLNLTLTPITDERLAPLAALTELRQLSLASTSCTGEGFRHLRTLTRLSNLNMHHAETNDAGLKAIAGVGDLERLWIAHTHFTDAGAKYIAAHKHLNRLGIGSRDEGSSGKTIAAVADLPLTELELFDRQATDEGLAHAAGIETLRLLNIAYGPKVTDASMPGIAALPALVELEVYGARFTDRGIAQLAAAEGLRKVSLRGLKQVTPQAIERLQQARPELVIDAK